MAADESSKKRHRSSEHSSAAAAANVAGSDALSPGAPPRRKKAAGKPARLVSLDAYRGFIMTMLAANGFGILAFSRIDADAPVWQQHDRSFWQRVSFHFDHPAWESITGTAGVAFWDLIQPAFMFMVGVSMPFSYAARAAQGASGVSRMLHALVRSVVLVLMGVFLYSMGHDRTNWIFPNVLAQIGLGYFFAWLLLNQRRFVQWGALLVLLAGYWAVFYLNPPPAGYDFAAIHADAEKGEVYTGRFAAWSKNGNKAFFVDQWLLPQLRSTPPAEVEEPGEDSADSRNGDTAALPAQDAPVVSSDTKAAPAAEPGPVTEALPAAADAATADPPQKKMLWQWFFSTTEPYEVNRGGYTTLNFVPSIGTALLGIICGHLLMSTAVSSGRKLVVLLVIAAACLGLGVAAHHTVCPIVKRIWTPSWVLFSGGYVVGMLGLFYLLFDLLPLRILAFPLVVVGTNSILTYMLGQTIRGWTTRQVVHTHFSGLIESVFGPRALDPQWYGPVTDSTATFLVFWLFLFWLYRQRIFLRV